VLAGLAAAHRAGIVHGDLKPENILLSERAASSAFGAPGCVKIADFGLGRWMPERKANPSGSVVFSRELPVTGVHGAGSESYLAPEQRTGGAVDGRADLYALGVVLHEMLTGERPAGAEVPSTLNPAVPGWLDEVYCRAYARIDWRFASADAMLEALERKSPRALKAEPGDIPASARQVCPQCRGRVEAGDQFCVHCGVQLVRQIRRCEACGGYPAPDDAFCTCCGSKLAQPAPAI
jgi:serine/threonine-protein kinase